MDALYHDSISNASGIYRIRCKSTNRIYIGSATNLHRRRQDHWGGLRSKRHPNRYLQHAWNKHGEDDFTFEIIEFVLIPFLLEREQYWLDKTKAYKHNKGYNINCTAGSRLGSEVSLETREKLRVANLGKKHSEEAKRKVGIASLGHVLSATACAKISASKNKTLIVTAPDGTVYIVVGITSFCKEHNIARTSLMRVVQGRYSHIKGWKARLPD